MCDDTTTSWLRRNSKEPGVDLTCTLFVIAEVVPGSTNGRSFYEYNV